MFGRKRVDVPEWAEPLGPKGYSAFISAVDGYFRGRGEPYVIKDGFVRRESDGQEFGFGNLVQVCAQIRPGDYAQCIYNQFSTMDEDKKFRENLNASDFSQVEQYIAVRLYPSEYAKFMNTGNTAAALRPFAGDVFATLVYDFPHTVSNISKIDMEQWGKTPDELFTIGLENVRRNYDLTPEIVNVEGNDFFAINSEHFFAPNILFELDRHPELVGRYGSIVAIPRRNTVMIFPIQGRAVALVNLTTLFFAMVPAMYQAGPGPLTPEVFWYHDGQYETLNYHNGQYEMTDQSTLGKSIQFFPSDDFTAMMNDLAEQADQQ